MVEEPGFGNIDINCVNIETSHLDDFSEGLRVSDGMGAKLQGLTEFNMFKEPKEMTLTGISSSRFFSPVTDKTTSDRTSK